jgi:hypothetical protein
MPDLGLSALLAGAIRRGLFMSREQCYKGLLIMQYVVGVSLISGDYRGRLDGVNVADDNEIESK